jgi:DNA modification methylase
MPANAPTKEPETAAIFVDIKELRAWKNNPRINDHVVADVADSITRWGFGAPILARKADGEIIAGHTRLKAAIKLGLETVPVRYLDLSESEAHLLALADNRLGEKADWDVPELHELLVDLDPIDLEMAGWSVEELEQLGKDALREGGGGDDGEAHEDETDLELPAEPITQPGDVWVLGKHRLLCGDSTKPESWARVLLKGEQLDMVFTDPPYGVDYEKKVEYLIKAGRASKSMPIQNDLAEDDLGALLEGVFARLHENCRDGAVWYVCSPQGLQFLEFGQALAKLGMWRQSITWVKDHLVLGRGDYQNITEQIFYGWKEGTHRPPPDRKQTTAWKFDRPHRSDLHPTMKPVKLVAHALAMSSVEDELVADAFGGSGTTLVAAEQLGRRCRTIELSPAYCDVIVRRWEELTQQTAVREPA